jgi:predicted component of type VI protein secretion system
MPQEMWEVTDTPLEIGRLDTADIAIRDKSVSRQHARILPTPSGFEIEDLGSVNGTWLNDRQITDRTQLSNGDRLMIGDVPLTVEVVQAQQPAPVVLDATTSPPVTPGGPSTVYYDLNDALAAVTPVEVEDSTLVEAETVTPQPVVITPAPRPRDFVPAFEPRPATPRDIITPVPTPTPTPAPTPRESVPEAPVVSAPDLSASDLIALADRLATALRVFKGDAGLALWLFNHAGGEAAVQAFADQLQRAQRDPSEVQKLVDMAPQAAELLQAAVLLGRVIASLGPHTPPEDESQANASHLQPVPRT